MIHFLVGLRLPFLNFQMVKMSNKKKKKTLTVTGFEVVHSKALLTSFDSIRFYVFMAKVAFIFYVLDEVIGRRVRL